LFHVYSIFAYVTWPKAHMDVFCSWISPAKQRLHFVVRGLRRSQLLIGLSLCPRNNSSTGGMSSHDCPSIHLYQLFKKTNITMENHHV
jgi:hypothetical protein